MTGERGSRRAAVVAGLLMASLLAACGQKAASGAPSGCTKLDASSNLVRTVMAHARSHFNSGAMDVQRQEFVGAGVYPIPAAQQRFGMTRWLTVGTVAVAAGDNGTGIAGLELNNAFATNDSGSVVFPIGDGVSTAVINFAMTVPSDPGWKAWVADNYDSAAYMTSARCWH